MSQKISRTLSLIKPDVSFDPEICAKIIMRYTSRGLLMRQMKCVEMGELLFVQLYGEYKGKPFYDKMREFYLSGPMFAFVWEGENAVASVRYINGPTDPNEGKPGEIRYDFGNHDHEPGMLFENAVHGSKDDVEAEREIKIFFD